MGNHLYVPQVHASSNKMWKSDKATKRDTFAYQQKLQKEKAAKIRKRLFFQELTDEEKNVDDKYRPELTSIAINPHIKASSYQNKQYSLWSVDQILHYLVTSARYAQNT